MRAYRISVNLKLGLIVFAVLIAVASLAYTNRLVRQLGEREQSIMQLWGKAYEQLSKAAQPQELNPYLPELRALEALLRRWQAGEGAGLPSPETIERYRRAVLWAQSMPQTSELSFITDAILVPNTFDIPAIVVDAETGRPVNWRNVPGVPDTLSIRSAEDSLRLMHRLEARLDAMAAAFEPIPIRIDYGDQRLEQRLYFDESNLVKQLRVFPYVQLLFVGLFILVGYLGFSYVRRSEQSSLWVGMAKEAAHQLGTPISSLMGWLEVLRLPGLPPAERQAALDEVERDVERLRRVANRFSDIGSLPKLERMAVAPVVAHTADYIRRRLPQQGKRVRLEVDVPPDLQAPLNPELFEWVVENLLKNALDAIETDEGRIEVQGWGENGKVHLEVRDTGKGIDRRQWKNVFRPGYSTKKRGWGLGLSLAKRIVEDYHGGTLTLAASRPGQGTTFHIELPAGR
ncbi:HAMP domain-containing histidine kinase [Rhodocaloribacter litoris]|uniref:sensor histidine kinase n=1 Tax=Rhodocaloribacter litoris TaxID=2558931 RepID=UPI001421E1DA|nr:HAMP domain-containing sensor histidine kinase [Rhodocaloribacter litoris]QXD14910.1 HAMP domain-containing histidine kinase [Rhodocaloribacter litoris]